MPGARRQSPGEDSDEGFCTTQRLVASVAALPTTTKTIHPQQTHHRTQQSALPGNSWSRLLQLAIFGLIFLLAPSTPQRTPHCCCCCCCCFLRVWMPRLTWVRPLRTNQLQQNHPLQHWNAASAAVVVVAFQTPPIAWTRSRNTFARTRATTTARFLSFSAVNTNNTSINSSSSSIGPRNNAMPSTTETIAPPIPPTLSNSALAEQRLEIFRAKRQARQRSIQAVNQRNLQLKNLLLMNPQQQPVEDESELQSAKVSSSSLLVAPEQTPPVLTTGSTIEATLNDGGHSDHGVAAAAASSSSSVLYQVKVLVSEDLRQELKLSGREKRGRVFLEAGSPALSSVPDLYQALHGFFRALKKGSFLLSASYPLSTTTTTTVDGTDSAPREQQQQQKQHTGLLPEVTAEGSTPHSPTNEKSNGESYDESTWFIESDADVVKTFARADDFFASMSSSSSSSASNALDLKRPSIVLHVKKNPNAPPPPPTPPYLLNMPDPSSSTHITMLSFYAFPPAPGIANPNDYATLLRTLWKPFAALGRVYVAHEGINAQMAVPTLVLDNFVQCCYNLPDQVGTCLQSQTSGGVNVDAIPLTRAEFAVAGIPAMPTDPTTTIMSTTPVPPFTNLHIRVRQQVVTDGLDRSYDWENAGYDMPAMEWHQRIKDEMNRRQLGKEENDSAVTILDCRNTYETDIGRFLGSEPLATETFRDSWDALKERLADTPKDAPIMTYCTGGIRCVKIGAYLTQELGFTNVARLAGGIISYDRTLNEKVPKEEALFKGTNFVFDGRLGRPITEDSLGSCLTCGSETSCVSNCRNENCHKRMVQCEQCRTGYSGTCSDACRRRLTNGAMRPRRNSVTSSVESDNDSKQTQTIPAFKNLDEYSSGHSSPVPTVYREMELNTRTLIPSGSHMVSGSVQGRLLTQLASMTREGRVLEVGTFTGYATACLLEGAANAGRAIQLDDRANTSNELNERKKGGPYVLTMERDSKAFDVAVAQLKVICEFGIDTEAAAEAMCALRTGRDNSNAMVPVVNESSILLSFQDGIAGCELRRVSDALAAIEEMAEGLGEQLHPSPFDMVFLDADKTRLIEYTEAFLSNDRILKRGGLIVVDNVLWKGLVLEASSGEFTSLEEFADSEETELRKNRRARKLANKMHRFNSDIVKDVRAEVLVLPMRDGLSVIRKK